MESKYEWTSGTIYGRLVTTGKSYKNAQGKRYVEAICSCEARTIKWYRLDGLGASKSGSISCGCAEKERLIRDKIRRTHGQVKHPLYRVYRLMMERCYRPKNNRYNAYGAKGVTVCPEWASKDGGFESFFEWAKDKWQKGLQLDKDIKYHLKHGVNTGGMEYSPEYCQFVTSKENSNAKTTARYLEYRGEKKTCVDWSVELGISTQLIYSRLEIFGWSVEKTLSTPVKQRKNSWSKKNNLTNSL